MADTFIDANIFLEVALGQKNGHRCAELLHAIATGEDKAFTSDFCIYSFLLALEREGVDYGRIEAATASVLSIRNLEIYRPDVADWVDAVRNCEKNEMDFDDSLVLSCMRRLGINTIATLDKDFEKAGVKFAIAPK